MSTSGDVEEALDLDAFDAATKAVSTQRPSMTLVWARHQIINSIRLTRTLPVTWAA